MSSSIRFKKCLTLAAVMVCLCAALTGCGRKAVKVNDYVTIEFSGYDTVGKAYASVDVEKMIDENQAAFGLNKNDSMEKAAMVALKAYAYFDGSLDKTSGLSNGDKVTFQWDEHTKDAEEAFEKASFKWGDITKEVSGLEKAEVTDIFEGVKVVFSGIAPNGKATIDGQADGLKLQYTLDKTSGLSNGDVVTVTATARYGGSVEDACAAAGKIPAATTKEYRVEGLPKYVTELKEIPKDAYDKMAQHVVDTMTAYAAAKWTGGELTGMDLLGNYLLTPKDPSLRVSNQNVLYFIYKNHFKSDTSDVTEYYYYGCIKDIMLLDDGTCSFSLGEMTFPNGSMSWGSIIYGEALKTDDNHYVQGYKDLDSMFAKLVTSQIDKYKYENTVKE